MIKTVTIPVVGTKVDAKKALIWTVVIIAILLFIIKGIPAIFKAIKTAIKGGINSIGDAISGDAYGSSTYQSAAVWNNHYLDAIGPNDPFSTKLYPQHAAASNLDYPTLVSIARAVRKSFGSGFLGFKISSGVESQFEAAFAPCLSQTDVSNVCIVYGEIFDGGNLAHDAIRDTVLLVNIGEYNQDGSIMAVALQAFIQRVNKLPVA